MSDKISFTNMKPAHIDICLYIFVHTAINTETKFEIILYLGQLNCSKGELILNDFIYTNLERSDGNNLHKVNVGNFPYILIFKSE